MEPPVVAPDPSNAANGKKPTKKTSADPPFQRRDLIDQVKKHFIHGATSHGALTERLVLYGCSGLGKLTIAAQVAKEITAHDGRRLLWINGHTFVSFIRDYAPLYYQLTGRHLPSGLGLKLAFMKIKHELELRRQDWFMVVANLSVFANQEPKVTAFLPDRGHILVTSNAMIKSPSHIDGRRIVGGVAMISALEFANNATELYVKGLVDADVQQLVRHLCPDLLRISWNDFGKLQRWARAVPLFLRITGINLRLLGVGFITYRKQFEKQFTLVHNSPQKNVSLYKLAFHMATKIMWDALGDHDVWAQKLLVALSVVTRHEPVLLRLIENLPTFSRTTIDHLSPALSRLVSLGVVVMSGDSPECKVSIMHSDVACWVWARVRRTYSYEDQERIVTGWTHCLNSELSSSQPPSSTANDTAALSPVASPYHLHKVWAIFPIISDLVDAIPLLVPNVYLNFYAIPKSPSWPKRTVLKFLLYTTEALITDRSVPALAGQFVDEAQRVLLSLRYQLNRDEFHAYTLRVKLVRLTSLMALNDRVPAEHDLRMAKRSLIILSASEKPGDDSWTYDHHNLQTGYPTAVAVSTPAVNPISPSPPAPPLPTSNSGTEVQETASDCTVSAQALLEYRRRLEDLETQLMLSQRRYPAAHDHLAQLLCPTPSATSLSDSMVLAQRYTWLAFALSNSSPDAMHSLSWSHAAMDIWTTLSEEERWGKGQRLGVDVLAWVELHVDLLMGMAKYKGALLFLPKLLDVWLELSPAGYGKVWRLARRLVQCYVRSDMVMDAEKVVERMLGTLTGSDGLEYLSGVGVNGTGTRFDGEDPSTADGRETCWWMLIELAEGYIKVGSVIVAEGLIRFCLGSWRRRYVGGTEEIEIVVQETATRAETKRLQEEENARKKAEWIERQTTWKKNVPLHWWALLIDTMVLQGMTQEPRMLVDDLVSSLEQGGPACDRLEKTFLRRINAYRQMREVYQRALWTEEEGYFREWKMCLGDSRERFLLRRAVRAFGSLTRRNREKIEFSSDIDLNLASHAKRSKVLHLLDRNWGHRDGCAPGIRGEQVTFVEDVSTTTVVTQRFMCDFWRWCQCKKMRQRAWSIDYVDYVAKRFIREEDSREQKPKPLKQTTLDGWLYSIIDTPIRQQGCCQGCPCIEANVIGVIEYAALEERLWTYTPTPRSHLIAMSKVKPRYKSAEVTCNELPSAEMWLDVDDPKYDKQKGVRVWKWYQSELCAGEADGESYVVRGAPEIPAIKITTVENNREDLDETEPPELEGPLDAMWSNKDKSVMRLDFQAGKANEPQETKQEQNQVEPKKAERADKEDKPVKKRRKRDKRSWFFNPSDYFTRTRKETIEEYLVMDEKTRKKYERQKKEIVILDENYVEIEKIPADESREGEDTPKVTEGVEGEGEGGESAEGAEGAKDTVEGERANLHSDGEDGDDVTEPEPEGKESAEAHAGASDAVPDDKGAEEGCANGNQLGARNDEGEEIGAIAGVGLEASS